VDKERDYDKLELEAEYSHEVIDKNSEDLVNIIDFLKCII
jgi:hypothetical protein